MEHEGSSASPAAAEAPGELAADVKSSALLVGLAATVVGAALLLGRAIGA